MRLLHKIRLGLAVVVGVPILLFGAYAAISEYFGGTGTLHFVAPADGPLTVRIDGTDRATLQPGAHRELELDQGDHAIELVDARGETTARSVEVDSGFYEALVPAAGQCWAELDVYDTYYGTDTPPPLPELEDRYGPDEPIEVGSSEHWSEDDLPYSVQEDSSVHLMLQMPCDWMQMEEGPLLASLGYRR